MKTIPAVRSKNYFKMLILVALIALTILLYRHRGIIQEFAKYGYAGIFFISMLSNATLIFPIPGVIFTSAMGAVFNPFWVALSAGFGATLGEMTGYLAGYGGQPVIEQKEWYRKMNVWMKKYGSLTVLILAFIPNPIFDITGIAAGALRMPVRKFLFWCTLGKVLKMLIFALMGNSVMRYVNI